MSLVAQGVPPLTVISIAPSAVSGPVAFDTTPEIKIVSGSIIVIDTVSEHPLVASVAVHV